MKFAQIAAPDFDLQKTLESGQVFHWERQRNGFVGTIGNAAVYIEQVGDSLRAAGGDAARRNRVSRHTAGGAARSQTAAGLRERIARYFALDHPLGQICASFPSDPAMSAAREFCVGLRIIRQPKWECLATFICSSMKQVAHIRQMSRALREGFGGKQILCGVPVHAFPSATKLARTTEQELRRCALGYRAKNLLATARQVATGKVNLELWSGFSDAELREHLCGLPGVGPKVANCVMLFAYERISAFPIDVWIERVLREKYFAGRESAASSRVLAEFAASYFGAHGGYAQQYLFHHARMTKLRA